jgi:hypothetical protein
MPAAIFIKVGLMDLLSSAALWHTWCSLLRALCCCCCWRNLVLLLLLL